MNRLLIIDDDVNLANVLSRAFVRRGWEVDLVTNVSEALQEATDLQPDHILLDLKLGEESGLKLLPALHQQLPDCLIVMLTGYGSIATAVEAIKLGAVHYLSKPVGVDEIIAAFAKLDGDAGAEVSGRTMTVDRVEWEHIQRVLSEHDGNISAAARALNMHRRTLQRKLDKRPSPTPDGV